MTNFGREEGTENGIKDSRKKSSFLVFKGIISFQNLSFFLFMIFSVTPAAFCEMIYTKLEVLTTSFQYGFIQPLIVLIILNTGLIAIKIIGRYTGKEKEISSKVIIFFILLLLNMIFFTFYFFQFGPNIDNNTDNFLKFMGRVGLSWLYVLPYNFFLFYPLLISIYLWNFRYPEKYVISFFRVVVHENMVAVFVGLLLNVLLSAVPLFFVLIQSDSSLLENGNFIEKIIYSLHPFFEQRAGSLEAFHIIALIQFWIGSFILWFTPLFASLTQLEAKFEADFDRILRDKIQKMKDHIVVIGFGNLGKRVCYDLIERNIISATKDTNEILTPDLELRRICNNLLIVDLNDGLFDRVHVDPVFQNVGIARVRIRINGNKENFLIPAIIGDINNETIRDNSRLKKAKLFISAPSDYKATYTLSKFANAEDSDCIITVEDSTQKEYFTPKMAAHDAFFIYPAFQEGISLGRIMSLCYFRLREKASDDPYIVIAGEGKQINYLIETFWMEMERTGIANSWIEKEKPDKDENLNKKRYRMPITILTENREFMRSNNIKNGEEIQLGEEIIKRSALIDDNNAYSLVDLVYDSPSKLKTIEKIISEKKPKILVVTAKTIQEVSRIFRGWVIAIERSISVSDRNYKPMIIVGVLGMEYEEIQDVLLYYMKKNPESGTEFPIQHLDAAVRVYDDSSEQIGGMTQAFARKYSSDDIKKINEPFAVYCCLNDIPGNLAYQLGNLAGIDFKPLDPPKTNSLISFHFCRFQKCSGVGNYSFLSNAELRIVDNNYKDYKLFRCLLQSENPEKRKDTREKIVGLLDMENIKSVSERLHIEDYHLCEYIERHPRCKRRITCSISSYLRKIENLTKNREYYEQLEKLDKFQRQKDDPDQESTIDQELNRFFINRRSDCTSSEKPPKKQIPPQAAILICCRHPEITGSLASAINNLFFMEINDIKKEDIADITYLRSYECYDPTTTYVEFYGNFVEINEDKREILREKGPIDLVLIDVVTKKDRWLDYAQNLCEVLNNFYKNDGYELWTDNKSLPNIIVVIRKGFARFTENDPVQIRDLKCEKKECIVHNKIRLLRK